MPSSNSRDVQLIVRARTEGQRLVDALKESLIELAGANEAMANGGVRDASKLQQLGAAYTTISNAMPKLEANADRVGAAFERQQGQMAATAAQLRAVQAQIEAASRAVAAGPENIVSARIAGGDGSKEIAQYEGAKAALVQLNRQQQQLTASLAQQEAALEGVRGKYQEVASVANAAGAAAQQGPAIAAEAAALERDTALWRAHAAAIEASAITQQANAAAAAHIRAELNPLAALQERYNADLRVARDLQRAGALSAAELAEREAQLARQLKNSSDQMERVGRGASGKPSLFGMKPYELTNLGYQVNDVVSGIAMGQRPMQIIAQQGGQILQLMPKVGSAVISALGNPAILTAAAAFGVVALAIARAEAEAQRLRGFEGLLHSIGDSAAYSARNLTDSAAAIQRIGVSATDANAAVTRFVRDGVDPARLAEFARAAHDLADVLSINMSDAATQVGAAFTGNFDAIVHLQEATQFLTAAELEQIRTLFDEGRAAEARNRALDLFTHRMDDAAQKSRGPWAQAGRDLGRIWDSVIGALAESPQIQETIVGLNQLADALDRVAGAGGNVAVNPPAHLSAAAVQSRLSQLEHNLGMVEHLLTVRPNDTQLQQWKADVERRIANLRTTGAETGDPRSPQSNAAQQESLDIARQHAQQMSLIDLQRRYDELTEADRRFGESVNANQRIAIQGQIAFNNTLVETHNRQRALNSQLEAEARERARITSEARQGEQGAIQGFVRQTMAAESSGNNNATNPHSTALGQGQFLEQTWLTLFRRYFPSQAQTMGATAILELRRNQQVTQRLIELYARENAEVLRRAGQSVTTLNLYLAHYLGPTGAVNLLRAAPGTPIRQALSGNAAPGSPADRRAGAAVAANVELRRNPTAGQAIAAIRQRYGGNVGPENQARTDVLEQINQLEAQRAVQQDALNRRIDEENSERERTTTVARTLLGLSGEQRNTAERQATVDNAIAAAQRQAAQQQLTLDDAAGQTRLAKIRETVAAEWDVAHAREAATRLLDEATGERQAILDRLQAAQQAGDAGTVAALQAQLVAIDARMPALIEHVIEYWHAYSTPEARAAVQGLLQLRDGLHRTEQEMARAPVDQQSQRLQAVRQGLQEQINFFQSQGMTGIAEQLRGQLHAVDTQLIATLDSLIHFWSESRDPAGPEMVLQFQNLRNQIAATQDQFRISAGDIQQSFATDLTNAATQWAQAIGEGGNVIRATADAARSFAASFIRDLAEMLLKAAALKLAMKLGFGGPAGALNSLLNVAPLAAAGTLLHSAGSGLTTAGGTLAVAAAVWAPVAAALQAAATTLLVANAIRSAAVFHGGGIIGQGGGTRSVSAGWFAGAQRFHGGGLPGLRHDEIPTILQRGEEVLARSNPRHILNAGGRGATLGGGDQAVNLKNVIVFDPGDVMKHGLSSTVGEQTFFTFVRNNADALRSAMGVN